MKNRLPSAVILLALLLVLCLHAFAAENGNDSGTQTLLSSNAGYLFTDLRDELDPVYTDILSPVTLQVAAVGLQASPDITVNGTSIGLAATRTMVNEETYLAVIPVLQAFCPSVQVHYADGCLTASAPTLSFSATVGKAYFMVNDHYLYAPNDVIEQDGQVMLPAARLAQALGCSMTGQGLEEDIVMKQVAPPVSAKTYEEEALYWLSRAIFSESGNQPMNGRIAVGTVILNRVANDAFPNTVKEVVFAPNQFSPVSMGTIYRDPDQDSIIAAKLCLDGVREAGESLYFNTTTMYSWADQSREYVCTIGGHKFYL